MNLSWIPSRKGGLRNYSRLCSKAIESGLLAGYSNVPPFYDEPRLYNLVGSLNLSEKIRDFSRIVAEGQSLGTVGGASIDKNRAFGKLIGEAVERFTLLPSRECDAEIYASFDSLLPEIAVDPDSMCAGTRDHNRSRRKDPVGWMKGWTLPSSEEAWIPSQLILVPHLFGPEETIWRAPITTGAAAGTSLEESVYRGLCEVIERDAFVVSWLTQLPLEELLISSLRPKNPEGILLARTLKAAARYELEVHFFVLPTAVGLASILCALWDRTGSGPPVTLGARVSWSVEAAMLGALEEAHQLRPWLRRLFEQYPEGRSTTSPSTLEDRALLWLSCNAIGQLTSWLSLSSRSLSIDELDAELVSLGNLVDAVAKDGGSIFYVDLTRRIPPGFQSAGLVSAKVVVPEFQPLYLTEDLKDLAFPRLRSIESRLGIKPMRTVDDLVSFPHPFL